MVTWSAVATASDGMAQLVGSRALAHLVTVESVGARLAGWRNAGKKVVRAPNRILGNSSVHASVSASERECCLCINIYVSVYNVYTGPKLLTKVLKLIKHSKMKDHSNGD